MPIGKAKPQERMKPEQLKLMDHFIQPDWENVRNVNLSPQKLIFFALNDMVVFLQEKLNIITCILSEQF